MSSCSSFKIQLAGSSEEIQAVKAVMEKSLKLDLSQKGSQFEVDDNYSVAYAWDFADMAKEMANAARGVEFVIEGCTDSTTGGELMDFSVAYQGGKLTFASSGWYGIFNPRDYRDYETYRREYLSNFPLPDDGTEPDVEINLTREEFEALLYRFSTAYRLEDRSIVKEVPMTNFKEIPLN